jgi:hypothetical protein
VWKIWAPSKVAVFPKNFCRIGCPLVRQKLWKWGVIADVSASTCVLYGLKSESADHLFDFCNQISQVWYGILRWLSLELVPPRGVL